jgi:ADP-ribose pyrophosphatase YjhB (NUDIX family)
VDVQRKVTCFVTRGRGAKAQLLVFWHVGAGVQVPAGSVEDGETFDEGAWREVQEKTEIEDLELVGYLGSKTYDLSREWSTLRREVELRTLPAHDAGHIPWKLSRNLNVRVIERRPGFARIEYTEGDLEHPGGLVYARFEGWVSEDDLHDRQERRFYHFLAANSPEKWQVREGIYDLDLYWVS